MTSHQIYITSEEYDNHQNVPTLYSNVDESKNTPILYSDVDHRQTFKNINTSISNKGIFNPLTTISYSKISYPKDTSEFKLLCLLADGTNGDKLDKSMEININPGNDPSKHVLCKIPVPGKQIKLQKNNTTYYLQMNGNNINCSDITVITKKKTDINQFQQLLSYMKDNENLLIKHKDNNNCFNQILLKQNELPEEVKDNYQQNSVVYKEKNFNNLEDLMKKIKKNNNSQLYEYNVCYYENDKYFKINENIFHFEFIDDKSIQIDALNFYVLDDIIDKMVNDRCCKMCTIL